MTAIKNKQIGISKDVEELEPLRSVGRDVKWYDGCGKQWWGGALEH